MGGLIIGQAVVSANLVSPIVVMIVALTALGSMVIPEEEFAAAFRLLKYVFLFLGGYLGIFGIVLGIYLTVAHLSGLLSCGMPYLLPFIKKRTLPRCWRRNPADPVQEEMAEAALCKMGTENPSAEK